MSDRHDPERHDPDRHDPVDAPDSAQPEMRDELRRVARPTEERMQRRGRDEWILEGLPFALRLSVALPAALFVLWALPRLGGFDIRMHWAVVAGLTLLVPVVYIVMRRPPQDVELREVLERVDDDYRLDDRLSAADEFLQAGEADGIRQCAIDDARARVASIGEARAAALAQDATWPLAWRDALVAGAVALLVALPPLLAPGGLDEGTRGADAAGRGRSAVSEDARGERAVSDKPQSEAPRNEERPVDDRPRKNGRDRIADAGMPDGRRQSRGQHGTGRSSQASSTKGQSAGDGPPTSQAQETKGGKKSGEAKKQKDGKKRAKKPSKPVAPEERKPSVASSGQGKGRGSSRSPAASEWVSKEQSVADDEEALEDEDDVEDEDEESEARGGLQPSLRQRKPPVNRDLTIGFGGGKPPPHANGRGGPSMPKKQRGVAQLVLGVHYPDQITGTPNPGRTKVTQERIDPQARASKRVQGEVRTARAQGFGHVARPRLSDAQERAVRRYARARESAARARKSAASNGGK